MTLHQGDCVHLTSDEHLYQVIGVDDDQNRCWVRRWPMARHGSPVFEISLQLVHGLPHAGHSCPIYSVGARQGEAQGHGSPHPGPAAWSQAQAQALACSSQAGS